MEICIALIWIISISVIKLLLLAVIQLPGAMHSIPHKCSAAGESGGKSSRPKICLNNTVLNHPGYLNYHSEGWKRSVILWLLDAIFLSHLSFAMSYGYVKLPLI